MTCKTCGTKTTNGTTCTFCEWVRTGYPPQETLPVAPEKPDPWWMDLLGVLGLVALLAGVYGLAWLLDTATSVRP